MRRILGFAATALVATLALTGCTGGSAPAPEEIADPLPSGLVDEFVGATEHALAAAGAPGAIVGVWVPWAGEWKAGVGEDKPDGKKPQTDMAFRAGTITRSMTCDVLYAMDGGAVRIDDSITAYVPSVPQLEDVTLGSLCDSEAGLRSSGDLNWNQILPNPEREWTPREFVSAGLGARQGTPGTWNDSDTSYFLLGYALENATHTPLAELIEKYVTDPGKLHRTSLPGSAAAKPGSSSLPGFYSSSAIRQAGCEEPPAEYTKISSSMGYADSGVVSTIDDLGSYTARLARQVGDLDDAPARWADSLPVDTDGDQWIRAAGGDRFYGTMVGQEGSILGYSTAAYSDINTGVTVAVTLNNSAAGGDIVGALARELAAIAMTAEGKHKPEDAALPWTVEQAHDAVSAAAVCPL